MFVELAELDESISANHGWPMGMVAWSVGKDGNAAIEVHVVRTKDGKAERARHSFHFYGGTSHKGIASTARISLRDTWQAEGLPDFHMRSTKHVLRAIEAGQADYTAMLRSIAMDSDSVELRSTIHGMLNDATG